MPIPLERGRINDPLDQVAFSYSNNSLGLRGPDHGSKSKPRILLLGDSITYGLGVNDDQTFALLLQNQTAYDVVNGGNPNTGTDYALKFYREVGRTLKPDIVILTFVENDFRDNQRHWYFDDHLNPVPLPYTVAHPQERMHPLRSWLVDHSRLIYVIKDALNGSVYDKGIQAELTRTYLVALRDAVTTDGAQFVLFYCPARNHLQEPFDTEHALLEIAQSSHIGVNSFRSALTSSDYLKEGHWNQSGHKKAADIIAERLRAPNK